MPRYRKLRVRITHMPNHGVLLQIIGPLLIFIALGFLAKQFKQITVDHSKALMSFVMNIAIPVMILVDLTDTSIAHDWSYLHFFLTFLGISALMFVLSLFYARYIRRHSLLFSSYFAATASLSNTCMIALPILTLILPHSGATYGVLGVIVLILGLQTMSLIYAWHHQQKGSVWKNTLKSLCSAFSENYFIALIAGLILSYFNITLPRSIHTGLALIGNCTGPIALFAIGAQLDFSVFKHNLSLMLESTLIKLVIMPLLAWWICRFLHLSLPAMVAVVMSSSVASAKCQYALARKQNMYVDFTASAVAGSTILSIISLSIIIVVLFNHYPALAHL